MILDLDGAMPPGGVIIQPWDFYSDHIYSCLNFPPRPECIALA